MRFEIVTASPEMAKSIAKVHIKSWQSAYKDIIPQSFLENLSVENRANRYRFGNDRDEGHYFFVAKLDDKIIGLLHLCRCRDEDAQDKGEISAIYLQPENWGKGYGRKMMEYSLDLLKVEGYKKVVIWVLKDNKRTIDFYKKFGFGFDGRKKTIKLGKELTVARYSKNI